MTSLNYLELLEGFIIMLGFLFIAMEIFRTAKLKFPCVNLPDGVVRPIHFLLWIFMCISVTMFLNKLGEWL